MNGRTLTALLLMMPYVLGTAQKNVDSLRQAYEKELVPEEKIIQAMALGNHYFQFRQDSAEYYFAEARIALPPTGYDSLFIKVYERSSILKEMQGMNPEALSLAHKAWQRVKESGREKDIDQMYILLGRYHMRATEYDSALYYWNLLLESKEEKGEEYLKWLPYHYIASLYDDINDWPKAKEYYIKALDQVRLEKRPKDYLYLLYIVIETSRKRNEMDLYSQLRDEYLAFKQGQKMNILSSDHSTLMTVDATPEELRRQLFEYLPFHVRNKSYFSACDTWFRIGQTYLSENKYDEAIDALLHMLPYTDTINIPALKHNGHVEIYKAYLAKGDFENALHHYQIVFMLWDSISNMDKQLQMNELNVRYETTEKEKQLAETNLRLESSKKNQQLLSFGLVGALMITGLSYYALRTKKKSNKQLEEKNKVISKALNEKDILLREIHHRVKNNLQMISALLYLHGKSLDDAPAQAALKESENRVQSMAMIHQNLYQQENLLGVGVKEYLDKLIHHLIDSYNIEKDRIDIHKRIEIQHLDVDTVIPLALIINELVSNALKYAFRDGRKGMIDISLYQQDGLIHLEVKDNGMGLPETLKEGSGNFGFKLIHILADRLGATLQIQSSNGTSVSLFVPQSKAA